eukprot:TRINITY_DN1886_c0_g1_i1.p1 TRINITY_DN1886_c0_g1~~TRINITY_DN1886_c0_g1_i1.p1  ORF type:complete len:1985 (-),score=180.40 TRINITY_DN1886_c0_g1_i1:1112-7066(-)
MAVMATEEEDKKTEVQETFREKLKRNILEVYFEMMKERNLSVTFAIIMILLMTLQLIGYIYYEKAGFPFKDDLYHTISSLADIVRIYPAIESSHNSGAYWGFQYLFLGLIVLYIFQAIYVDYSINIGKFFFDFPLKALRNMNSIFFWVLVSPIVETFVSIFSCSNGRHIVDTSMECWTGMHIFYCFLFSIGLLLFLTIGLAIAILYNESRPNAVDGLARLDISLELYLFVYRVCVAIVSHFAASDTYHWLLIVIYVLGSLNFVVLYMKYIPFYNPKVSIVYGICICSYFWTSLNLLILKLLENTEYTGQSVVIIVGILIIIPLTQNIRDKYIHQILFGYRHDKIREEHELDIYIKKILDLLTDQSRNEVDELVLLGFVNNHKTECVHPECPLISKEELYLPATGNSLPPDKKNFKDPILVLHLLRTIYAIYTKTSNFKAMLHLTYSYFLFAYMGNIHMAIIELDLAEKMDITLQQMFSIYRNKKFIESYLISKYNKKTSDDLEKRSFQNLDVTVVIVFENLYSKLLKAIEKSANEHIEFWSQLDSLLPDLNMLHKLGLNITTYSKQTEDIWKQLIKINSNHHKALRNYGSYLRDIRNDEEAGFECIEKAKAFKYSKSVDEHMNDFSIMFADDTAIVVMSAGNKETQGKITKTNTGITNLFKYNPLEVTGQDVSILMPPAIASKHNQFLERYFTTGKEKVVNNERELYAMPRTGCVICISTIVKPVPSLKDDIQYIGLIRQRNKDDDFVLMNPLGKIDSMSESLSGKFRFQHNFFKENEVYVQFLCPELLNLELSQSGTLCTSLENLNGYHELTFILPKDFHSIVQGYSKNINVTRQQTTTEGDNDLLSEDPTSQLNNNLEPRTKEKTKGKAPESVKRISQLIHGTGYQKDLTSTRNILKEAINYDLNELKEKWVVEVKDLQFGDGKLKLKVFRVMTHKANEDGTSEKFYGVKSTPSKTRARPEEIERLKSVGLNPESRTSSSNIRLGSSDNLRREEQKSSLVLPSSPINDVLEEAKEIRLQSSDSSSPPVGREPQDTTFTELRGASSASHDLSGISPTIPSGPSKPNESRVENPNDLSVSLNISKAENTPLIPTYPVTPLRKYPTNREQFLQKSQHISDEQDAVIRNLLKAKGDLVTPLESNKEENSEEGKAVPVQKKEEAPENNMNDDVGSVASRTKSLMKHIRALRNAVYEQYCPRSVQQLTYVARFVFLILLVITLVYFIIAKGLYENLKANVSNVYHSKNRLVYTTAIGACVRSLVLINPAARSEGKPVIDLKVKDDTDYYADGFEGNPITGFRSMNYQEWAYYCIEESAKGAKIAQNGLSTSPFTFSEKSLNLINPATIKVNYKQEAQIAGDFTLDCWSATMGLVIHGLKVKDMPLANITMNDPSVYYILQNSFNNILDSIYLSTSTIQDESKRTADSNRNVLMILLIVASVAIAISVVLILRVAVMVTHNKEDILKLFIDIPARSIKQQLNKCRRYFITFRDFDKMDFGEREMEIEEEEEEKKDENEEKEKDENGQEDEDSKKKDESAKLIEEDDAGEERVSRSRKNKKKRYKPYSTHLLLLILKFTFFIALLEGYFLGSYFKSVYFLSTAINLIMEIGTLASRTFSNGFLYRVLQEYVGTNGTVAVQGMNSERYITKKIAESVEDQENFLKQHSDNMGINSDEYNDFYNKVIYNDACESLFSTEDERKACEKYPVLKKGLHSANIAYWDTIREVVDDFQKLKGIDRTLSVISGVFEDRKLRDAERMQNRYFTHAYQELLGILDKNLQKRFNDEYNTILILFIAYLAVLFILYFFVWTLFVESTRNSLWVTKCMLGIIPVSTILEVKNIKDFLINSSKGLMLNLGSDQRRYYSFIISCAHDNKALHKYVLKLMQDPYNEASMWNTHIASLQCKGYNMCMRQEDCANMYQIAIESSIWGQFPLNTIQQEHREIICISIYSSHCVPYSIMLGGNMKYYKVSKWQLCNKEGKDQEICVEEN